MRSSTLTSAVAALLSIHSAVALNHRRYPTTLATFTIAATPAVHRRHEGGNHEEGGEYGFGGYGGEDQAARLTEGTDNQLSRSTSTKSKTVTITADSQVANSGAAPTEVSSNQAAASSVSEAVKSKVDIRTSNNANVEPSQNAAVDGNGKQLSFVPTTIFASGEGPTITVTAAPRTITQVQVTTVTAPQESCETKASSALPSSPAKAEPVTITQLQTLVQTAPRETVTITVAGIEGIGAVAPETPKSSNLDQNQAEYAKTPYGTTVSPTLSVMPTPIRAGQYGAGSGTIGAGGQCQCACPCESAGFSSTRFPVIPSTPSASASAPAVSLETVPFFTTTLDAPLATPEIGAIPNEQGNSAANQIAGSDTELVLATSTVASSTVTATVSPSLSLSPAEETAGFFTTTLDAPLETPEIGQIPNSAASGTGAQNSEVDTEIVLATSTIASSTTTTTAVITPSGAEEAAQVFTTTLDAPLETPEIGQIPKNAAGQDSGEEVVIAISTVASSTVTATAIVTPSAAPTPSPAIEDAAPVFTTTLDAPLETPEIGAIPKDQAAQGEGQGGEFFMASAPEPTPITPVAEGVPSQTRVEAEVVPTRAAEPELAVTGQGEGEGGEAGEGGAGIEDEVDIGKYTLSSVIELGNMG